MKPRGKIAALSSYFMPLVCGTLVSAFLLLLYAVSGMWATHGTALPVGQMIYILAIYYPLLIVLFTIYQVFSGHKKIKAARRSLEEKRMRDVEILEIILQNRTIETIWNKPQLGRLLLCEGYITRGQLQQALSEQRLKMGELLLGEKRITSRQLHSALDYQKKFRLRFGEVLKTLGMATVEDIDWALEVKERRLGEILKDKKVITDYELRNVLALQNNTLTAGPFSP